jgi:flagellar FliL protein
VAEDDEPIAEGEEVEAPPKRKIPLLFVIIGGVALLLIIAGAVGLLVFGKRKPPPAAKHEAASSAMEFGGHVDNADENAQRAAALARAAADGNPASTSNAAH